MILRIVHGVLGGFVEIAGHLDLCGPDLVEGWLHWPFSADKPRLQVFIEGMLLGECVADRFRVDLKEAGLADGHLAFSFRIPKGLAIRDYTSVRLRLGTVMYMLPDEFTAFPKSDGKLAIVSRGDALVSPVARTRVTAG